MYVVDLVQTSHEFCLNLVENSSLEKKRALLEPTNLGLYDMFKRNWMILEVCGEMIRVDWIWAREYHIGSQIGHLSDVLYLND